MKAYFILTGIYDKSHAGNVHVKPPISGNIFACTQKAGISLDWAMRKSKLLDFSFSFFKQSRRERIISKHRNVSGVDHMIPPFWCKDLDFCYYIRFGRCK